MNPVIEQMAHDLAAALFNGVYQGIVLAMVVWLGFKLFRGSNAATRHAVTFVALLAVGLLPVFHLVPSATDRELFNPGTEAALVPSPSEELFAESLRLDPAGTSFRTSGSSDAESG